MQIQTDDLLFESSVFGEKLLSTITQIILDPEMDDRAILCFQNRKIASQLSLDKDTFNFTKPFNRIEHSKRYVTTAIDSERGYLELSLEHRFNIYSII